MEMKEEKQVQKELTEDENEVFPYSKLEREEDILELLCLWERQKLPLDVRIISEHFGMEKKDILICLKQMYEYRYVEKPRANREVVLTPYGRSVGNEHIYRHTSISQHLQFIGVHEKVAEQDACRIEHVMSEESVRAVCQFANYENMYYERRIRNSELADRYEPGVYTFIMQMYSLEQSHPRRLAKEYNNYSRDILLRIKDNRGYFELKRKKEVAGKPMWYQNTTNEWVQAELGEYGEMIPASMFEFVIKPNDRVMEGTILITFMNDKDGEPDRWSCEQLEIEIW